MRIHKGIILVYKRTSLFKNIFHPKNIYLEVEKGLEYDQEINVLNLFEIVIHSETNYYIKFMI